MAWAGKPSGKQKTMLSIKGRTQPRPMPKAQFENPNGIPTEVIKQISREGLSSDPAAFNRRLQELLAAYKLTDGR